MGVIMGHFAKRRPQDLAACLRDRKAWQVSSFGGGGGRSKGGIKMLGCNAKAFCDGKELLEPLALGGVMTETP